MAWVYKSQEQVLARYSTANYINFLSKLYFLVDDLSDIFSLGIIVYEMAASNRQFLSDSLTTISNRIISQMPYGRSRYWLPIAIRKCHRRWMPCWCRPCAAENSRLGVFPLTFLTKSIILIVRK
jgi:hypothetical protein